MRIILDTDIGTDIDDAYALAFILSRPQLDLVAVSTVYGPVARRATMARALLEVAGRGEIPVITGLPGPGDPQEQAGQLDWGERYWREHPRPEATAKGEGEGAAGLAWIARTIMDSEEPISLVSIGALTNIARLLELEPRLAGKVHLYALMGGSVRKGYNGQPPPIPEYNIKCDVPAAQAVFAAGWQPLVTPLDVTMPQVLDEGRRARIAAGSRPLCRALADLYPTWGHRDPVLHDPPAIALMLRPDLATLEYLRLMVDGEGFTREVTGEPNTLTATACPPAPFLDYYLATVLGEQP